MLITFTGDVSGIVPSYGPPTSVRLNLVDHTSGMQVQVVCIGELVDVAKELKIGQVMQVVGWTNKIGAGLIQVLPFILRAQSGTNEADINAITTRYTAGLLENKSAALQTEVASLKTEMIRLREALIKERTDAETLTTSVGDLNAENLRLRKSLEETDRELQYERLVKETVE